MPDPIAGYQRSMQRRNLSLATVDKRVRTLQLFDREVGLATATREQIEDFLDHRSLSPKSRSVWLSHLACYYRWCAAEGLIGHDSDPTARIGRPKLRRRLPRPVTDKELTKLLVGTSPRMRAMILLASLGGLRCCEVANLQVEDILAEGSLRLRGKGDKERLVPTHPSVLAALQALPLPDEGPVFDTSAGAVSHAIGAHIHKVGIVGGAHRLRHSFASAVYKETRDLRLVQELLGHESPQTTAIYCAFSSEAARSAVGRLKAG